VKKKSQKMPKIEETNFSKTADFEEKDVFYAFLVNF
jgi:hypothetical protein